MDFFLLLLIGRLGLASLYELREKAALQPGAIRSTLQRLEDENLIVRSEAGRRSLRILSLANDGYELLDREWTMCLRDYPDVESVLRAAFVALLMGGLEKAVSYLEQLSSSRRQTAVRRLAESEYREKSQFDALARYAWMRTTAEAHRRSAESDAFRSISHFLTEIDQHERPHP